MIIQCNAIIIDCFLFVSCGRSLTADVGKNFFQTKLYTLSLANDQFVSKDSFYKAIRGYQCPKSVSNILTEKMF